jgi:hypothetical protein
MQLKATHIWKLSRCEKVFFFVSPMWQGACSSWSLLFFQLISFNTFTLSHLETAGKSWSPCGKYNFELQRTFVTSNVLPATRTEGTGMTPRATRKQTREPFGILELNGKDLRKITWINFFKTWSLICIVIQCLCDVISTAAFVWRLV